MVFVRIHYLHLNSAQVATNRPGAALPPWDITLQLSQMKLNLSSIETIQNICVYVYLSLQALRAPLANSGQGLTIYLYNSSWLSLRGV